MTDITELALAYLHECLEVARAVGAALSNGLAGLVGRFKV